MMCVVESIEPKVVRNWPKRAMCLHKHTEFLWNEEITMTYGHYLLTTTYSQLSIHLYLLTTNSDPSRLALCRRSLNPLFKLLEVGGYILYVNDENKISPTRTPENCNLIFSNHSTRKSRYIIYPIF